MQVLISDSQCPWFVHSRDAQDFRAQTQRFSVGQRLPLRVLLQPCQSDGDDLTLASKKMMALQQPLKVLIVCSVFPESALTVT